MSDTSQLDDAINVNRPKRLGRGRVRGAKNKRTILRELQSAHVDPTRKAIDYLAEVLAYYRRMADAEPSKFTHWMGLVMECATRLAKYQSPTFQAIAVTGDTLDQARLAKMSNAELAMALKARAESLGMEVRMRPQINQKGRAFIHEIDEKIIPNEQQRPPDDV